MTRAYASFSAASMASYEVSPRETRPATRRRTVARNASFSRCSCAAPSAEPEPVSSTASACANAPSAATRCARAASRVPFQSFDSAPSAGEAVGVADRDLELAAGGFVGASDILAAAERRRRAVLVDDIGKEHRGAARHGRCRRCRWRGRRPRSSWREACAWNRSPSAERAGTARLSASKLASPCLLGHGKVRLRSAQNRTAPPRGRTPPHKLSPGSRRRWRTLRHRRAPASPGRPRTRACRS